MFAPRFPPVCALAACPLFPRQHAFYLQYKNDKMAYLSAIWDVVNWAEVGARYDAATAGGK